jgi:nucleotide-binding universal stress UspA family protein
MNPSPHIHHILVAHDFSETTEPALAYAISIAKKFESRLTIVHAYEPPSYGYPESLVADLEFETRVDRAARQTLENVGARVRSHALTVDVVLRKETPWSAIVDVAEKHDVDLIVIGTHGRKGVARALLGSVAEKVVRSATRPVLTVHGATASPKPTWRD